MTLLRLPRPQLSLAFRTSAVRCCLRTVGRDGQDEVMKARSGSSYGAAVRAAERVPTVVPPPLALCGFFEDFTSSFES